MKITEKQLDNSNRNTSKELQEHYYSKKQSSRFQPFEIECDVLGHNIKLYSASGVFSKNELDKATKLLIENAVILPKAKILDLGCGLGIVGITIAKLNPETTVTMADINERAVRLAKMNKERHHLDNAEVIESDCFQKISDDDFDTILLNPPMLAGRPLCFSMVEQAKDYLKVGGLLQLVARHTKGGKMLSKKMEEVFGNVRDHAKGSGFRVYISQKQLQFNN